MITNGSTSGYLTSFNRDERWLRELPPVVQDALRDSVADWACKSIFNVLTKERKARSEAEAVQAVLDMIERWNASEREDHLYRLERLRKLGTDYNAPVRHRKVKDK